LLSKDEEPIAFGLVALKLQISIPHEMAGTDPVEQAISGVEGVQRVEVEMVSML
jgi:translation elongation factor aEF-1 beta